VVLVVQGLLDYQVNRLKVQGAHVDRVGLFYPYLDLVHLVNLAGQVVLLLLVRLVAPFLLLLQLARGVQEGLVCQESLVVQVSQEYLALHQHLLDHLRILVPQEGLVVLVVLWFLPLNLDVLKDQPFQLLQFDLQAL
jgi:hypothetical protein